MSSCTSSYSSAHLHFFHLHLHFFHQKLAVCFWHHKVKSSILLIFCDWKFCSEHPNNVSYITFTCYRPFYVRQPTAKYRDTCLCKKHENIQLGVDKLYQSGASKKKKNVENKSAKVTRVCEKRVIEAAESKRVSESSLPSTFTMCGISLQPTEHWKHWKIALKQMKLCFMWTFLKKIRFVKLQQSQPVSPFQWQQ